MANDFSVLFQPIKIGKMEIKNRLAVPPMGNGFVPTVDGGVGHRHLKYYETRARGGFGLIISEMVTVDREMGLRAPTLLCLHDDSLIPGFKELASTVHQYGAKLAIQIVHPGRCVLPAFIGGRSPLGPSAIADPIEKILPRALTVDEINDLVENFAQAALRTKKAGCDAVEIHGAHGYLISQFMSPYANRRHDDYGDGLEGYTRFPVQIVKRSRELVGPDFPILFRISADEAVPMGRTVTDSIKIMQRLVEAGINAADISIGVFESIHYMCTSPSLPQGFNAGLAERFKKVLKVPVLVTGRINEPEVAVDIIKSGKADIVHIGRQSLADPEWPEKVKEGRTEDIVKCLSCNEACIDALAVHHRDITCVQNLMVGREEQYSQPKTDKPKKVLVAGGGPGGLEAARTGALRGHHVILFEKDAVLGGQIHYAAMPPAKSIYQEIVKSRVKAIKALHVDVRLGQPLTIDIIKESKPDVLIIATGSEPYIPSNIPGIHRQNVITAKQALCTEDIGRNVLVIGGGLVGCEAADDLSNKGHNVTIVEILDQVAGGMSPVVRFFLIERLMEKQVKTMTGRLVKSIKDDGILMETAQGEENLGPFDTIVLAVGAKPVNDFQEMANDLVPEVYVIGDAAKPGKILAAVEQGAEIALGL